MKKVIFAIAVIAAAGLSTLKATQTNDYQLSNLSLGQVEALATIEGCWDDGVEYCVYNPHANRCECTIMHYSACPDYACE